MLKCFSAIRKSSTITSPGRPNLMKTPSGERAQEVPGWPAALTPFLPLLVSSQWHSRPPAPCLCLKLLPCVWDHTEKKAESISRS